MASCLSMTIANAQVFWQTDGNATIDPTNDYLGTNENDPLNFRTDSIFRMRLWNTVNTAVNGYPASKRNGFIGISDVPAFFTNSPGAFTRIHLVDPGECHQQPQHLCAATGLPAVAAQWCYHDGQQRPVLHRSQVQRQRQQRSGAAMER